MKTAIPAIVAAVPCLLLVGWAVLGATIDGYRENNCRRVLDVQGSFDSGAPTYFWVTYRPGVPEWVCFRAR